MTSDDLLHKPYTTITNTKTTYVIFLTVDYTVKDGLQSIHVVSMSSPELLKFQITHLLT